MNRTQHLWLKQDTHTHTHTHTQWIPVITTASAFHNTMEHKYKGTKSQLPVFLLQTETSQIHTYTHTHTHKTEKIYTTEINKRRPEWKLIKRGMLHTQDSKDSDFFSSCVCQSLHLLELRWSWCGWCACVRHSGTWLSQAALRSVWKVWEDFWKAAFWNKSLWMQRLPCGFVRWLALCCQAAGGKVEHCWQWSEVAEWTTGALLIRGCSSLFKSCADHWPLSHLHRQC